MMDIYQTINKEKIIVIVRRTYGQDLLELAVAMKKGGLRIMELTFDQGDENKNQKTPSSIRMLYEKLGNEMIFGAGTVLTVEEVDLAKSAGAKFIISPNTNSMVIKHTKLQGLISIPGAMTPSEMVDANHAGADFIKVFPVDQLGLNYVKAIFSPLNHLKLIATGGVTLENFPDYLKIGMVGAGVSGYLTNKELIMKRDFDELTKRASMFHRLTL